MSKRRGLVILAAAATLSLAADEGTAPWHQMFAYGRDIMTKEERAEYRAQLRSKKTYDEKLAFWRSHVARMKQRAWDRGLALEEAPEVIPAEVRDAGPRRPVYGMVLMTGEEVEAYRAAERAVLRENPAGYEAFLREHEIAMKKRAWDRGLYLRPTPAEREAEEKRAEEERARIAAQRRAARAERINLRNLE